MSAPPQMTRESYLIDPELAEKLGVRNVCLHKGLPAPGFSDEHCHPKDVFQAALDFPGINFLIYHAGVRGLDREIVQRA